MPSTLATILAAAATIILLLPVTAEAGGFKARANRTANATYCDANHPSPQCDPVGLGAELEMINVQSQVSQRQMAVQMASSVAARLGNCDICGNIGK